MTEVVEAKYGWCQNWVWLLCVSPTMLQRCHHLEQFLFFGKGGINVPLDANYTTGTNTKYLLPKVRSTEMKINCNNHLWCTIPSFLNMGYFCSKLLLKAWKVVHFKYEFSSYYEELTLDFKAATYRWVEILIVVGVYVILSDCWHTSYYVVDAF